MTTDSVRLGILKQLSAYIATEVTPANGYAFDLTAAVFRGRVLFGSEDPVPMVSILEGMMPDANPLTAGFGEEDQTDKWTLIIQGWVQDDDVNPTDPAHQLMASVKQALGKLRKQSNNLGLKGTPFAFVAEFVIGPGVVRPADQLSAKAYFWQRITLQIIEEVDSPFL
jgi:hypothetical protein